MKAGAVLRKWRKSTRRPLRDVAAIIGVSEVTISDWERGKKRPRVEHASLIERLTGGEIPAASWLSEKEKRAWADREQRVAAEAVR
jgi:transcriptional regulator with XRE-family HTH domain